MAVGLAAVIRSSASASILFLLHELRHHLLAVLEVADPRGLLPLVQVLVLVLVLLSLLPLPMLPLLLLLLVLLLLLLLLPLSLVPPLLLVGPGRQGRR